MNPSQLTVKERILCAAIWYDNGRDHVHQPKNIKSGYVVCGRRHHNIISIVHDLSGICTKEGSSSQGFLTTADRFVDRIEAMHIAFTAGQVPEEHYNNSKQLFSEDLY